MASGLTARSTIVRVDLDAVVEKEVFENYAARDARHGELSQKGMTRPAPCPVGAVRAEYMSPLVALICRC